MMKAGLDHSGANFKDLIIEMLVEWSLGLGDVTLILTDGCGKEKLAATLATTEGPAEDSTSGVCDNHTLHNALQYACGNKIHTKDKQPDDSKNNTVGIAYMKKVRKVIGHFKHSGKAMAKLKVLQINAMKKMISEGEKKYTFPFDRPRGSLKFSMTKKRAAPPAPAAAAAAAAARPRAVGGGD